MEVTTQTAKNVEARLAISAPHLVGTFSILGIITFLQNLMKMFAACQDILPASASGETPEPEQTPQEFLEEHYDGTVYDPSVLRRATTRARKDAKKKAKHGEGTKLTVADAELVAIAALDEARLSPPGTEISITQELSSPMPTEEPS